jgi:SAM-dependent methyltransferase
MPSFLFLVALFLLITAAYAGLKGAPWVPTLSKDVKQALGVLKDKKFEHALDLGCGTGTMLFALAKEKPNAILTGYDVSLAPLLFGWTRKFLSPKKYKNVHLYWKNIYSVDVSFADVIYVFMMPESNVRIATTVLPHAKPDATILFEAWGPEGFIADHTEKQEGCLPLLVYRGSAFRA